MSTRNAQPGIAEREHHGWGALLKYIEAFAIAYRYDRYPRTSKTGKKFERFLKATRELRDQLNWEYGWVAARPILDQRPSHDRHEKWVEARQQALTSDVYNSDELRALQQHVIHEIENGPPEQVLKALGYSRDERALYHEENRAVFMQKVEQLAVAAQGQTQALPWQPRGLLPIAPPTVTLPAAHGPVDCHADLRSAMRENPDQPQATFVKRFGAHPLTVKRCRRELEKAGAIPVLPHRHGHSLGGRRRAQLTEAAAD